MIIIKYRNVTYFVNDAWLFVFSFLIGNLVILILKSCWDTRKKKSSVPDDKRLKGKLFSCRGGGGDLDVRKLIEKCLKEEGIYEVKPAYLKNILKHMLGVKSKKSLITNVSVLVTGLIASQMPSMAVRTFQFNQLQVMITNKIMAKVWVGLGLAASAGTTGILVFLQAPAIVLAPITAGMIGVFIGANAILNRIDCDEFFYKLPKLNPTTSFVERIAENKGKVFIQTSPEQNLFLPDPRSTNQVTIAMLDSKYKLMCPAEVTVTSRDKYVPLSERTKTLQDIIHGDDTEVRQGAKQILESLARKVKQERLNLSIEESKD